MPSSPIRPAGDQRPEQREQYDEQPQQGVSPSVAEQMTRRLDTRSMLEAGYYHAMEGIDTETPLSAEASSGLGDEARPVSLYERTILELSKLRDDMAESFINVSQDPALANFVRTAVHRVEGMVRRMGGQIEPFNEINYMSSLGKVATDSTGILMNATRVIENTKTNYKSASCTIEKMATKVVDGRPAIQLKIVGEDGGRAYQAYGQVVADTDFSGNEAIDFVRKNGLQQFSVRAVQLGHWRDVTDDFQISMKSVSQPPAQQQPVAQQPNQVVQPARPSGPTGRAPAQG